MPLSLQTYNTGELESHLNRAAQEDELEVVIFLVRHGVRWSPATMAAAINGAHHSGSYRTLLWLIEQGCPPVNKGFG
jgi:hypothetical protein